MIFVYDTQDEMIRLACSSGYWDCSGQVGHTYLSFYRQQEDGVPFIVEPDEAYIAGEAIGRSEVPKDIAMAVIALQGVGVASMNGEHYMMDFTSKQGALGDCSDEAIALLDLGHSPRDVVQKLIDSAISLQVFGTVRTHEFNQFKLPEWGGAYYPIKGLA